MNHEEIVHLVNTDPVAQTLLELPIPMRLGYLGLDGLPRSVPVTHIWNGKGFAFGTPSSTYKVRALTTNPRVAFTIDIGPGPSADVARARVAATLGTPVADYTPLVMMGRGIATVEIHQGIPQEHIDASRRMVGNDDKWREWQQHRRSATEEMALITVVPTHINIIDFITRFPPPAQENAKAHGAEQESPAPVG